eukprot:gb/GECG01001807.1/.p1 GENE.gb/GECG01001807.1/~~gb/GECG01001807.1/.p1  ORF type:complete len:415 (+),score=45.81 gb/GECG01001807.1/:1-1245(+)
MMEPPAHTCNGYSAPTHGEPTQSRAPTTMSSVSSTPNGIASSASECTTQQELSEKAIERLVKQCPELSILRACNNGISHVHGSIQKLQNLEVLDLRNNEIHDLSFLAKLPQLREVDVRGCPISRNVPFKELVQHIRTCCPWISRINGVSVYAPSSQLSTVNRARLNASDQQLTTKPTTSRLEVWQQKVFELLVNLRMRERAWLDAQSQWKRERQYLLKTVHSRLRNDGQQQDLRRFLDAAQMISSVVDSVDEGFQKFEYATRKKLRTLGHRADTAKLYISSVQAKVLNKYDQLNRLCKKLKTEWTELEGYQVFDAIQSNSMGKGRQEEVELQLVDSFDTLSLRSFCKELIGRKYALLRQVQAMEDEGHSQCNQEITRLRTDLSDVKSMYEEEKRSRTVAEQEVTRLEKKTKREG